MYTYACVRGGELSCANPPPIHTLAPEPPPSSKVHYVARRGANRVGEPPSIDGNARARRRLHTFYVSLRARRVATPRGSTGDSDLPGMGHPPTGGKLPPNVRNVTAGRIRWI